MPSRSKKQKSRSKKFARYKLLLDEGLPPTKAYPQLNSLHDVKHVTHDLGLSGVDDPIIYKIAEKESRLVVVFNTKHFRPLIESNKPSIIALSPNISSTQADLKLCKALRGINPSQTKGCLITITNEGITFILQKPNPDRSRN